MKLTPNLTAFLLLVAALAAGGLVPVFVASALVMTLLTQAAISAVLATGVGILLRQNGVVSFGHAAYFGIACYTIGLALRHKVMATETAIILALVIPTALAFLLGLVIVRIP
ncbi:MAG: branched-chain amino acid ABC transporter permease, partial [Alphaproteobacteria bacterium]|nr:branched-chain amino acid ABC transporter permease [Alphaproteobacteria bacterium]